MRKFGKLTFSRWLVAAAVLTAAECAAVVAIDASLTVPAQAQSRDERFPFLSRQRPRTGGFFGNFFGPSEQRSYEQRAPSEAPADYSRAPPPRKPEKGEAVPTTSIMVMGDGMADWLAYGLEDAFADSPEIGIVRKFKAHSGLLHYEGKGDLDWWHVARDLVTQEKPNYVVMMLGVGDRQNIREKDLAKEAEKKAKDEQEKKDADKAKDADKGKDADTSAQTKDQSDEADQSSIVAPEPTPGKTARGVIEFRSDQWADIYAKRIDATIAAMKSRGVPVFWVGLPSIRGPKSTADAVYLNDLYRARAERAGVTYIDVWDGFVDEGGKFATFGPDYEGQMRRLRSGDGVFFTKAGARKLAHYVERELRRAMSNRTLVSLPSGPGGPVPATKSTVRPLAGPVVPLTVTPSNSDELAGAGTAQPAHNDATAVRVLVEGEPIPPAPGRADDFVWPPGSARASAPVAATAPVAPATSTPAVNAVARTEPAAAAKPLEEPKRDTLEKRGPTEKTTQNVATKPKLVRPEETKRKPVLQDNAPRPPRAIPRSGGPFGWFR